MKPTNFPESNSTLGGGPAIKYGTQNDVTDLPVHSGDGQVISCWQLDWRDRLRLLLTAKVWLLVLGANHAPVKVTTEKPFVRAT